MSLISKAFIYPALYAVDKTLKHPILASVFTPPLLLGGSYGMYMQVGARSLLLASAATAVVLLVPAAVTGIVCSFSPKARAAVKSCFFSVLGRMLSIFITNALDNPRVLNIINHFVKDQGQQALIAGVINDPNSKDNLKNVVRELCKGKNLEALYGLKGSKSRYADAVKFFAQLEVSNTVSQFITSIIGGNLISTYLLSGVNQSIPAVYRDLVAHILSTNHVQLNALISELLKPENINALSALKAPLDVYLVAAKALKDDKENVNKQKAVSDAMNALLAIAVPFLAKQDVASKVSGLVTGVVSSEVVRPTLLAVANSKIPDPTLQALVAAVLNTNHVQINALIGELLKPENINGFGQFPLLRKAALDAQKAYDDAVAKGGQEPVGVKLGVINLAYAKLQDANKNYSSLMNLFWRSEVVEYDVMRSVFYANTPITSAFLGLIGGVLDANAVIDKVLVIAQSKMVHLDIQKVEDKVTKRQRLEKDEEVAVRVNQEIASYDLVTQLLKTPAALGAVKDLIKNVLSSPQIAYDSFVMYSAYKVYSAAPQDQKQVAMHNMILAVMPLLQKDPGVYHSVLKPFIAAMIKVLGDDRILKALKSFIPAEYQGVAADVLKSADVGNKLVELIDAVVGQPVEEIVGLYDKYAVLSQAKEELRKADSRQMEAERQAAEAQDVVEEAQRGVEEAQHKVKAAQNALISEGLKFVSGLQVANAVSGLVGGLLDNFNTDEKKGHLNTLLDTVLVTHAPKVEGEAEHRYYQYEVALSNMLKAILGADQVKGGIKDLVPLLLTHNTVPKLAALGVAFQAYSGVEEGQDDTKELIAVLKATSSLLGDGGVDNAVGNVVVQAIRALKQNPQLLQNFIKTNIIDTERQIHEFERIIRVLNGLEAGEIKADKTLHPGGLRALLDAYHLDTSDDNKNAVRKYLESRISKYAGNQMLCKLIGDSINGNVVQNLSNIVEGLSGNIGEAIDLYADYSQHDVDHKAKRIQDLKRVYNALDGEALPEQIDYDSGKKTKLHSDELCNLLYAYNKTQLQDLDNKVMLKKKIIESIQQEFTKAGVDVAAVEAAQAVQKIENWSEDFKERSAKLIQKVVLQEELIYGSVINIVNAVLPHAKAIAADKMRKSSTAIGRMLLADDNGTYGQIVSTIQQILIQLKNTFVAEQNGPLYIFNHMYDNWTNDSSIGSSAQDAICSNQKIFDAILEPARRYIANTGAEPKGDLLWLIPAGKRMLPIKGVLPSLSNGPIKRAVAGGWVAIAELIARGLAKGAVKLGVAALGAVKTGLTQAPVESAKQVVTNVFGAFWSVTKGVATTTIGTAQAGYETLAGKAKSREQQLFEEIQSDGTQQSLATRIFNALDGRVDNTSLWQILYDGNFKEFREEMTIKQSVIDIKINAPSISELNLDGCVVQSNIKVNALKSLKLKNVTIPLDVLLEICNRSQAITLEGVTITKPLNPLKVLTVISQDDKLLKYLEEKCKDMSSSSVEIFATLPVYVRVEIERIWSRITAVQQDLNYPGIPQILSRTKEEKFEMLISGDVPQGETLTDEEWLYCNGRLAAYSNYEIRRNALEQFMRVQDDTASLIFSHLSSSSSFIYNPDMSADVVDSQVLSSSIKIVLQQQKDNSAKGDDIPLD